MYLVHKASFKSSNSPPSGKPSHEWGKRRSQEFEKSVRDRHNGHTTRTWIFMATSAIWCSLFPYTLVMVLPSPEYT